MTDPTVSASHPSAAVGRYLDDLARMLHDVDPVERADVLGSVREYVDDSVRELAHPATEDDYGEILTRLGRPEQVVADVVDGGLVTPATARPTPAAAAGAPTAPGPAARSRLGEVALGLGVGALVLCLVPLVGAGLAIGAIVVGVLALRSGTASRGLAGTGIGLAVVGLLVSILAIVGLFTFRAAGTVVEESSIPAPTAPAN